MTDKEVMQMALAALERTYKMNSNDPQFQAVKALCTALAQPEPDYEAEFIKDWNEGKVRRVSDGKRMVPQREWVGLTDEEIREGNRESWVTTQAWESAVWWAEAKLKEKNSG